MKISPNDSSVLSSLLLAVGMTEFPEYNDRRVVAGPIRLWADIASAQTCDLTSADASDGSKQLYELGWSATDPEITLVIFGARVVVDAIEDEADVARLDTMYLHHDIQGGEAIYRDVPVQTSVSAAAIALDGATNETTKERYGTKRVAPAMFDAPLIVNLEKDGFALGCSATLTASGYKGRVELIGYAVRTPGISMPARQSKAGKMPTAEQLVSQLRRF